MIQTTSYVRLLNSNDSYRNDSLQCLTLRKRKSERCWHTDTQKKRFSRALTLSFWKPFQTHADDVVACNVAAHRVIDFKPQLRRRSENESKFDLQEKSLNCEGSKQKYPMPTGSTEEGSSSTSSPDYYAQVWTSVLEPSNDFCLAVSANDSTILPNTSRRLR